MTDAAAYPPGTPSPSQGEAQPSAAQSCAPDSAETSPLGDLTQYRLAPRLPSLHNQVSITGATKDDPAGKLVRQQVLYDPEWASPMQTFWLVLVRGYAASFLTYWLGYGFCLMVGLELAQVFFSPVHQLSSSVLGASLLVGPLFGLLLDFSIVSSTSAASLIAVLLLLAEPALAFLILITFEWRARLRYCGLMFGLVLVKAVLYVWVSSTG